MHKKSFTMGMGIGILAMVLVFYFAYSVQIGKYKEEDGVTPLAGDMDEDDPNVILEAARGLGMIFPGERESLRDISDEEVVFLAEKLGMVFPGEQDGLGSGENGEDSGEGDGANEEEALEDVAEQEAQATVYVEVEIGDNMSATSISKRLEEKGVIDSWEDFHQYVLDAGYSKKLYSGTFKLPLKGSYQEVLDRLIMKRR